MRLANFIALALPLAACGGTSTQKAVSPAKTIQRKAVSPFAPPARSTHLEDDEPNEADIENISPSSSATKTTLASQREPVTISMTFGGDISLNRSGQAPRSRGTGTGNNLTPWKDVAGSIIPFFKSSDLNFGNVETVVTPRNIETRTRKKYTFQSHVAGFEYLIESGLNLLSLANVALILAKPALESGSTRFAGLKENPNINYAGWWVKLSSPSYLQGKEKTIAFAAVGIISNMNLAHRTAQQGWYASVSRRQRLPTGDQ